METIETELVFADLEPAERRHARVVREARGGDKAAIAEQAWLEQVIDALQRGEPARRRARARRGAGRRCATSRR